MSKSAISAVNGKVSFLLDHGPYVTYMCRAYGDYAATYISNNLKQQLGYEVEQFLDDPAFWLNHIHPDDRQRVSGELSLLFNADQYSHNYRFRHADGEYRWMHDQLVLMRDEQGNPSEIIGYWIDITDQLQAEKKLHEESNILTSIMDNLIDGIITIDEYGLIKSFNRAAENMFGYRAHEVIGNNIKMLMPEPYFSEHDSYLEHYRKTGQGKILGNGPREVVAKAKNGTFISIDLATSETIIAGKRTFIGVVRDITERKKAADQIAAMAATDLLTGLANRSQFQVLLSHALSLAKRNRMRVGVLYLDIDKFKLLNDSLGHTAGDDLLRQAADRLRSTIRQSDTIARLGGDEFAIVIENFNRVGQLIPLADMLINAFEAPFNIKGHEIYSGLSIGISVFPSDSEDATVLMRNADIAMYRAKDMGRNTWQLFSHEMAKEIQQRQELDALLRRAIDNNQFVLYYQPQVDLRTGRIIGAEALLRWQHPEKGLIPPMEFIPILEETGLIGQVGDWVVDAACRQNQQWQAAGLPKIVVAVNLCAQNFRKNNFSQFIENILHKNKLDAKYLDIEITESTIITQTEEILKILNELKELGIKLSIDDFGTGYSSLSYLKRLPLNTLKIDRSFVTDVTTNIDSAAIARSIIAMAHSMGMNVVAEGIETKAQLNYLKKYQCEYMQGYYFSKPVPADEFTAYLAQGKKLALDKNTQGKSDDIILILDDDKNMTASLKRLFRHENYEVLTANTTRDAFDLLAANSISVVISDQSMPDMIGTEFLKSVKSLYPDTVRIVLSGHTELQAVSDAVNCGHIFKYLTKPWDDDELLGHIREAIDYYGLTITQAMANGA